MKKLFITLFLLGGMVTAGISQTTWTYSQYSLKFTTPSGFNVQTNNGQQFTGTAPGISLTIYPWSDASVTRDNLYSYLENYALNIGYSSLTDGDELDLNGYQGGYVEGIKDNYNAIIIGLLDPYSSTNFIVIISYYDSSVDAAYNLATSFQKAY